MSSPRYVYKGHEVTYEVNVLKQMQELAKECIKFRSLPIVLLTLDANQRGHALWPDGLPEELVAAIPLLLQDAIDDWGDGSERA